MAELETLFLSAVDTPMANAFRNVCGDLPFVEIHEGSILELEVDAVVSLAA